MTDKIQFKNPIVQLGWAKIDHVITFDPTLSDGAFRTYAIMIYHAQKNEAVYVSLDTIANERDLRRETISAHIKELEEHGLISRTPRAGTSSITEIEELPKVYQDMAAVIIYARNNKDARVLEKSHGEKNLTPLLEKPNNTCEENLTRERSKESDIRIGVPPDASELPSEDEVVGEENDAQAAWDAMESATKTPYNPDGVTEALTVLCETDKILTASRFSKKHRAKLSDLLARDPTREAFDEARESFPKAVMDGKAYASPDVFLGFYATAIDTLRIRSPIYSQEKQEFERPAPRKAVYDHDDMEF